MIEAEHWQIFGGMVAILVLLGSGAMALKRLGLIGGQGALGERVERHAIRLSDLERRVSGLAAREDIHQLQLEIATQTGELKEMRALMKGQSEIMERLEVVVTRHEDHLLERGKGR